jgi:hypothetical protein
MGRHSRNFWTITGCVFAIAVTPTTTLLSQTVPGCAPGTTCLSVQDGGGPGPGPSTAQCSGVFPDFVVPSAMAPTSPPWFKLSQNYPSTAPSGDAPWLNIDFSNGVQGANDYLYALRDYAFEGMTNVDFRPEDNKVRPWFHMPLMNFGPGRREPTHGLTSERPVTGPELGVKPGVTIHNYAIGFYNAAGAYTIGQVWKAASLPDLAKSRFVQGAMTFKILFSDATANDFSGPDLLAGAPSWSIATAAGTRAVRLMQMDVAAVDSRAPTGWVFGTLVFDRNASDTSSWRQMRPVGLSWGNDPGFTPADQQAGKKLSETTISDQAPAYAVAHLGWAGRTNGPVDNPISGCLSCHGTAQFPVVPLTFSASCDTDTKKLYWFRNFRGDQAFGSVDAATCTPVTPNPVPSPLDFSLQMKVAVQSALQYKNTNPCTAPSPEALKALSIPLPAAIEGAPRVRR